MDKEWWGPQELADWLGVPVKSVHAWRSKSVGPRGARIGRHVRYRRADVDRWLEERLDQRPPAA